MNWNIFQWRSLKTRVTVTTLAIFLVGIWVLAFYASQMLRKDMQHLLGEQQFSTASFIAADINQELADRLRALEKIAGGVSPAILDHTATLQIFLEQRLILQGQFNCCAIAYRLDGTAVAEVPLSAGRIGVNYMDVDAIATALKDGRSTISRPVMGKKLLAPVFGMVVPIRDTQGKVIGALAGVTDLNKSSFLDVVTDSRYGKSGGYLLIAPQYRMVVTATDKSRIMAALPAPGVNPMTDRAIRGGEGSAVGVNPLGMEVLASHKGVPVAGWYVAAVLPTSEAFAPIRAMQQRMLIATIFLSLLAGVLSWGMLRRQLSPMLAAVETLATLSDTGQPPQPLPIARQDEIGQLIGGFNRLLATLAQREEALKKSESFLSEILYNVDAYIYLKDTQGRYLYANRLVCELFGASVEEVLGQSAERFFDAETAAQLRNNDRPVLEDGETLRTENTTLNLKDGRTSTYLSVKLPLRNETGEIYALCGISTDITERKQAEEKLRIAAVAFELQQGMMVTDADGVIIRVNRAFTENTGYTAEEAVGQKPRLLRSGRHDKEFYREMRETLHRIGGWQGEIWDRRKSGEVYPKWLTISAVKGGDGAVTHYVGTHYDITERKKAEERIEALAFFDQLTELPNRNLLNDRVTQSISLARRTGQQLAMLCLDLDGFKFINDGFGHAVGDTLLKMVADRLKGVVRECDTVARLGGDEFALILLGLAGDSRDVGSMAQRVLDTFAQPFIFDSHQLHVTASIGVSVFPSDGDTHDVLLKNADVAMHNAKERGRNCFQFYAQEMSLRAEKRVTLESALRMALEHQQFEVHYQPKVDLRSGRISGVEALLRWHRPGHGMVPPDSFIDLAEETRLIVPIGEWVLRTACAQARKWHDMGFDDLSVAVNLSARQFDQQDIAQLVRQVLAETGLSARHLELELTESVLMNDSDVILKTLREIKEVGVVLTLDDFGTGYSSLSYLKRFPIDVLKIDRSFIRNVTTDTDDASLTKGIILLAQSLKMKTVAEGVETQGQLGFLSTNKCDAVQGFYFSRPVTADALSAMLQSNVGLPVMPETAGRQRTVLLLDDEPNVLSALARLFRQDGYQILQAHTPAEGFELLATHSVQVIISDQRMPLMTGTVFLGKVKELYPDTIRIILSGYTELTSVIGALNGGAVYRFFTKPWDDQVLRDQVREAFEHHWLIYGKPTQDDQARAP